MVCVVSEDLVKVYDNGVVALAGVSLKVPEGCVFSLLGRNGAGKTTFVKIASTQLLPTSGYVEVMGFDVVKEAEKVRRRVALVPQEGRPSLLNTPYEHILHYLIARGFSINEAKRRAREVLRMVELEEYANTMCSKLSGGLRQRTLVAMALASDAELLFLDEPTIGLDAITRVKIWDVIRSITKENNQTIILTTHYMQEAEELSDKIAIINDGRIVSMGGVEEIKGVLKGKVCVEFLNSKHVGEDDLKQFGPFITIGEYVRLYVDEGLKREALEFALKNSERAMIREVTLEDIFMMLVGRGSDGG